MKNRARALFKDAINKVKEANNELCRPEEDVVSFSVCKKSQRATENFLKGFLLQNGVEPNRFNSLEELYNQCKIINKNFKKFDLSNFKCKSDHLDAKHCDEISKVNNCYTTADNLDNFLRQEKIIS